MKWSEIKSLFLELIGAGSAYPSQIDADTLLVWANMALREMTYETECLQRRQTVIVTSGTQEYDLPADCEKVLAAYYDGEKVYQTSKWDLQQCVRTWDTFEATPRKYYLNGMNGKVGLWPIPTVDTALIEETPSFGFIVSSDGPGVVVDTLVGDPLLSAPGIIYEVITGYSLELHYVARPAEIANDEDVPNVPAWAHPGILYFMLSKAYAIMGDQRQAEIHHYWARRFAEIVTCLSGQVQKNTPRSWTIRQRCEVGVDLVPLRFPEYITDPDA